MNTLKLDLILELCYRFYKSNYNREEEKQTQQIDDTANNNDEELRQQYLQDLQKRVKESRKQPDCFECCFAYWLFIFLGFVFRQLFLKKIDETPDGCDFIGLIISLLLIVFSLSAFCRCIDCCCILIHSNLLNTIYILSFLYLVKILVAFIYHQDSMILTTLLIFRHANGVQLY